MNDTSLATMRLAEQLIACPSITPNDAGCQAILVQRLTALGFVCETILSGPVDTQVTNLWAKFKPNRPIALVDTAQAAINSIAINPKTLVFAGHTDVVPAGPLAAWTSPPFVPTHADGKLYGRGASDMKTSLAAMVVACEEFLAANPQPAISIAFLITSDEEGPATDGSGVPATDRTRRNAGLVHCGRAHID